MQVVCVGAKLAGSSLIRVASSALFVYCACVLEDVARAVLAVLSPVLLQLGMHLFELAKYQLECLAGGT